MLWLLIFLAMVTAVVLGLLYAYVSKRHDSRKAYRDQNKFWQPGDVLSYKCGPKRNLVTWKPTGEMLLRDSHSGNQDIEDWFSGGWTNTTYQERAEKRRIKEFISSSLPYIDSVELFQKNLEKSLEEVQKQSEAMQSKVTREALEGLRQATTEPKKKGR